MAQAEPGGRQPSDWRVNTDRSDRPRPDGVRAVPCVPARGAPRPDHLERRCPGVSHGPRQGAGTVGRAGQPAGWDEPCSPARGHRPRRCPSGCRSAPVRPEPGASRPTPTQAVRRVEPPATGCWRHPAARGESGLTRHDAGVRETEHRLTAHPARSRPRRVPWVVRTARPEPNIPDRTPPMTMTSTQLWQRKVPDQR